MTMLTNSIKTGEYDAAVLSINVNSSGAHNNFEKAQLRLLGFKSLIGEHKINQSNFYSFEERGLGSGGRGRGRGGPGRGRGRGDSLSPRRADTTNRSTSLDIGHVAMVSLALIDQGLELQEA